MRVPQGNTGGTTFPKLNAVHKIIDSTLTFINISNRFCSIEMKSLSVAIEKLSGTIHTYIHKIVYRRKEEEKRYLIR